MGQSVYDRLAYSYVRDQEAALDVVQSAACKALERCGDIKMRRRSGRGFTGS